MSLTLLLENDPPDLVDKIALRIAEAKFPGYQLWAWFGRDMATNKKESKERLMALEAGDNIIMRHVFAYGYGQMEGMLRILEALTEKGVSINVWMVGRVSDELLNYLTHSYESDLDAPEKNKMNLRLINALADHNVYECWDSGILHADWMGMQTRITLSHLNSILEKEKEGCRHLMKEKKDGKMVCSDCARRIPHDPKD